ncbi:MAG TPA: hypothetical protein GX705_02640 [Clostridiales bacterium]|nr:hypothetical protein [Clostridiales bacterium]
MERRKQLKYKKRASFTLEAALVLPIFMFSIIVFIYLLQIMIIHDNLQEGITNIGLEAAKYGYIYDGLIEENKEDEIVDDALDMLIAKGIDSTFFKVALYDNVDSRLLEGSCIRGGFVGIHTYLSNYMEENDTVDVIINYKIEIPTLFFNIDNFQIVQRAKLRGWNGYKPLAKFKKETTEDTNEEMVYITETGTVYHTSRQCTHLRLSIKLVPFEQIPKLRNNSGGKYKKCQICASNSRPGNSVYITTNGDRYHINGNCSGLKRTIKEVPLSQVKGRSLCERCKK